MTTWTEALDALEQHLSDQERLLAAGRYAEMTAFEAPLDLPPLPIDLADRATVLIRRTQTLAERGAVLRADIGRLMRTTRRHVFLREPVSAAYVDQRA